MAKKAASSSSKPRTHHKKSKRTWSTYVYRTLKQVNEKGKEVGMSGRGMRVLNSFVQDIFDRLATEAAALTRVTGSKTLTSREVQTAVRLVLPAELAKHASAEAARAVAKLMDMKK